MFLNLISKVGSFVFPVITLAYQLVKSSSSIVIP
jgi:hypothetical protein